MEKGYLVLEDGKVFQGEKCGAAGSVVGWVTPHTAMAGYQEVITDPANQDMIISMSYPLVGNYGVNSNYSESIQGGAKGLLVRQLNREPSHWRSEGSLQEFMEEKGVVGLEEVDTRAVVRHLFRQGTMRGAITASRDEGEKALSSTSRLEEPCVKSSLPREEVWELPGPLLVVIDMGVRLSFLRALQRRGFSLAILPVSTFSYEQILAYSPQGVVVAGGGGSPWEIVQRKGEELKKLSGKFPLLGVALGAQVLYRLEGEEVGLLKTGHRGDSYPVKIHPGGKVYLTSQAHQYDLVPPPYGSCWEVAGHNLHDGTVESVFNPHQKILGIQFWPRFSIREEVFVEDRVESFMEIMKGETT